jgi:hypothetical protein
MRNIDTITVRELKDLLEGLDEDARVAFSCNYGDRGRTQQVISIRGDMEESNLYRSAYSESGWAVCRDSEDPTEDQIFIIA